MGEIFFDDATLDAMKALRAEIAEALAREKGLLQTEQSEGVASEYVSAVSSTSGQHARQVQGSGLQASRTSSAPRASEVQGKASQIVGLGEYQGSQQQQERNQDGVSGNALFGLGI